MLILFSLISLLIWLVLFFAWGNFWHTWESDFDRTQFPPPQTWPAVIAIVPARNEASSIAAVVKSLAAQAYLGEFSAIIVDDHSNDGTAELAEKAVLETTANPRIRLIRATELSNGWTGKLSALNAGVLQSSDSPPEFFWFTDADVVHASDTLERLVSCAQIRKSDLTSLMVQLNAETFAERLLIPPFLYFFLMLYPPKWTAAGNSRTAGAAGGCILLRRTAFERIGGLSTIRSEVIDDCALARVVKKRGGKTWMGLTRASQSLRSYSTFSEIREMIARTAYTQLRYSSLLLVGTLLALTLAFLSPVILTFSTNIRVWPLALAAWCLMTASFLPVLTYYRLTPVWAPMLPLAALFYGYATVLSAVRYWLGRGAQWKGRTQARRSSP